MHEPDRKNESVQGPENLSLQRITYVLALDSAAEVRHHLEYLNAAAFINPGAPDDDKILDCATAAPELERAFREKFPDVHWTKLLTD